MKYLALTAICLLLSSEANAVKIKVYKWVDEKGVVTFSEYRPESKDYEEIEVEGDRLIGKDQGLDYDLSSLQPKKVKGEVVEELNQQAAKYCEKARHNMKVLDSFNNVRLLDEDGNPKVLSKEEVMEQRRLANRQIEMFCPKSS
jgi:hypothetical protein